MVEDQMPRRAIALDLGGTQFRVAVGTSDGVIEWRVARLTETERGLQPVLDNLFEAVGEAIASVGDRKTIQGIGFAAPGPLDLSSGVILNPPNMPGWDRVPIRALFQDRFGLPTLVANDANLAAVGEHRYGAGRGLAHIIYVTVSTGIGGGIIVNNELLLGHCGFAGEVGHMTIDLHGPACPCGNVGCLEMLASGTAIGRRARELVRTGTQTGLARLPQEEITAKAVMELAYQGDSVCRQLLREAGTALGFGIASLSNLFNPQMIVIGGGVSNAGPLLWDAMREVVRTRAITACQREVDIVPAGLGDDAGLLGAVALVTHA